MPLLSLRWRDVDLERREIVVQETKTDRTARSVPISIRLAAVLEAVRGDSTGPALAAG